MRKLMLGVVGLALAVLLSSCGLLPFGSGVILDDSHEQADARMEQIGAAFNDGDPAALKALFSPRALEQAPDIDAGLEYLLSFFPEGGVTWERDAIGSEGENDGAGNKTRMLRANYKLIVGGEEYRLFFADITVNDVLDPENVGLYAIGVTPWSDMNQSDAAKLFSAWAGAIHYQGATGNGYPGVYVPE